VDADLVRRPRGPWGADVDEHRIFEQLGLRWQIPVFGLSSRTRVERRVRTNGPGSAENDANLSHWAHRLRDQIRIAWTLRPGRPWRIVAYDELFFRLSRSNYPSPSRPTIDQNRAFLGVGYDTPGFRVEAGYLNQYVHRFTDPDQINHILGVNIVIEIGTPTAPPAAPPGSRAVSG
jgi:hypothetical protein